MNENQENLIRMVMNPGAGVPTATRWVRQEDPNGCFVAAMAMVTGKTYAQVKEETGHAWMRGALDQTVENYLSQRGFAVTKWWQYDSCKAYAEQNGALDIKRNTWPLPPFAPIHVCQVKTRVTHWVVMLSNGNVLDPVTPEVKRLTDYAEVTLIMGVWRIPHVSAKD